MATSVMDDLTFPEDSTKVACEAIVAFKCITKNWFPFECIHKKFVTLMDLKLNAVEPNPRTCFFATSFEDDQTFPEDLAMEILQRLPVKPLLRFKCINKNWYKLINSPSFISIHLNYHENNKSPKILICDRRSIPIITLVSDSEGTPLIEKPDHRSRFAAGIFMVGPVDGLFLFLKGNTELVLWNPATRVVTTVPAAYFPLQPFFQDKGGFSGFGLDPFTSNYKVIWVRHFWDESSDSMFHRAYAAVYSSSNDSWRILKHKYHKILTTSGSYTCSYPDTTGYLNGAYYWMIKAENYGGLLSFDFHNEVFCEIRGPDIPPNYNCHSVILLDGSINLFARGFNTDFALWVMIQPGVWNKLLTFQCLSIIQPVWCGLWNLNNVIFLTENSRLISYDVKTHRTRHLGFQHQGDCCGCRVYYYKESLVTIKRENRDLDRPL